jgi:hypothetical protein
MKSEHPTQTGTQANNSTYLKLVSRVTNFMNRVDGPSSMVHGLLFSFVPFVLKNHMGSFQKKVGRFLLDAMGEGSNFT